LDTSTTALIDPDFLTIREDNRWTLFENKLISMLNVKYNNPYKDIEYAKELWRLRALDQAYFSEIEIAEKKIGMNSSVIKALWKLKFIINEKNQKKLEELIEKKGWPKISRVGKQAAGTAFYIIQHSDADKQKKGFNDVESLLKKKGFSYNDFIKINAK